MFTYLENQNEIKEEIFKISVLSNKYKEVEFIYRWNMHGFGRDIEIHFDYQNIVELTGYRLVIAKYQKLKKIRIFLRNINFLKNVIEKNFTKKFLQKIGVFFKFFKIIFFGENISEKFFEEIFLVKLIFVYIFLWKFFMVIFLR